jgi:hypothetical protein
MSCMRTLCLFFGDLDPTNPPKRFGGFHEKVVLRVDF